MSLSTRSALSQRERERERERERKNERKKERKKEREREREREEIGLNAYLRTKYVLVCAYKDVRTSLSPE